MDTRSAHHGGQRAAAAAWMTTFLLTAGETNGTNGSLERKRLRAGEHEAISTAAHLHVFVAAGSAVLGEATFLHRGDVMCLTESVAVDVVAGPDGADVLIWNGG